MSIQIGRAGVDITLSTDVLDRGSANSLTASGWIDASLSAADVKAQAAQILGLSENTDEPVVPVVSTDDDSINGFYRVLGSDVDTSPKLDPDAGPLRWTVELERVPGWQAPLFEIVCKGNDRTSAHSVTEVPIIGFPADASRHEFETTGNAFSASDTRTSASGDVLVGSHASAIYGDNLLLSIGAGDWYDGACRVELDGVEVVGRQLSNADTTAWRIGNGLVRVSMDGANAGRLMVQHYDGSAWKTAKEFIVYQREPVSLTDDVWDDDPASVTIMHNRPEMASVKVDMPEGGSVDITVRRGDRIAYAYFGFRFGTTPWTVYSPEALTGITGGARATSNDGEGDRLVLTSSAGITVSSQNFDITSGAKNWSVGFGMEIGGSGASGLDTADSIVGQYHGAVASTVRTTVR